MSSGIIKAIYKIRVLYLKRKKCENTFIRMCNKSTKLLLHIQMPTWKGMLHSPRQLYVSLDYCGINRNFLLIPQTILQSLMSLPLTFGMRLVCFDVIQTIWLSMTNWIRVMVSRCRSISIGKSTCHCRSVNNYKSIKASITWCLYVTSLLHYQPLWRLVRRDC